MNVRIVAGVIALLFLLSGCFSSDSSSGGMSDEDRAAAAASASVLSGSLDDPPDEDEDDGGNSGNSLMGQFARASTQAMTHCDGGGTHDAGFNASQNVGSPYTMDGTIDVDWDHYQDCVSSPGTDAEISMDGYVADGSTGDLTVSYARWASGPNTSLDNLGFFTMESSMGSWRFSGEMHTCDTCSSFHFANEMFVRWEIENEDTLATIGWGRPNDFLVATGDMVSQTALEQEINGYMTMSVDGTPCDLEVEYSTVTPLLIENFGTVDEQLVSGELNIEIVGSGTFNAEYINGELYIDGNLVDPDQPNPCDISLI